MAAAATAHESEPLEGEVMKVILVVSFGPLLLNLSSTTVNVALDSLMARFAVPLSTMQWIVTGYLLALTLVLPSFRFAVERLGSRRLYLYALFAFTVTSGLASCAWSAASLIAFRVLQGAVGGLLAPLTQTLIAQIAGPKRMGRAVAIISIPVMSAPLLGPVIGGLLVQHLSWRFLFAFNVPLGLAGVWLAWRKLPEGNEATRSRLDWRGLALISPGIGLFTLAVSSLAHGRALSLRVALPLVIAIALVTAFVFDARRRPTSALIDLRVFRHPAITASLAAYLLASLGSFGAQLVLPLYFEQARGESAFRAGLLLAPQGLGMLLSLPRIGRLTDRWGSGQVMIGGVVANLLGTWAFTTVTDHTSYVLLGAALVVRGAGLGATSAPALAAAYKHLTRDEIPNATAAINIVQRLGAPLGTATWAVMLQRFSAGTTDVARAFAHTFAVGMAISALSLFAGFALVKIGKGT
jgi:EmrB/QacA subfamily drug resistance transporter